MGELIKAFAPIMMFMLVPLWIPLVAIAAGAVSDRLKES